VNWIFLLGALLVTAGWLAYRRRMAGLRPGLSDDDIRAIERGEDLPAGDRLDLEEAAEEEERFWDETWDEPEPL
jgi:hypothetical protein